MGDGCLLPPKQPAVVFAAPLGVRGEEAGWKFQRGVMPLCLQQQERGLWFPHLCGKLLQGLRLQLCPRLSWFAVVKAAFKIQEMLRWCLVLACEMVKTVCEKQGGCEVEMFLGGRRGAP